MGLRLIALALCALAIVAAIFGLFTSHFTVLITLGVVALGAGSVVLVPRRRVVGGWLASSAFIGLMSLVSTRSLRPRTPLWPPSPTWSLTVIIATTMFGILIWLIMSDGFVDVAEAPTARVVRRSHE